VRVVIDQSSEEDFKAENKSDELKRVYKARIYLFIDWRKISC